MGVTEFLTALLSIVIIDLVLAGDNAIVLGLAARNLPKDKQKKVIVWGTIGAVIVRALATLAVVWLLKIPGLLLMGGIVLIWIAVKLLIEEKDHNVEATSSMWAAIRTIIIADAVMGLDNVLAVAGAAHGSFWLVLLGLMISVPIMVWGSTMILKLMEKLPWIIYVGSGVLAFTAAKMIVDEKLITMYFQDPLIKYGFILIVVAIVPWAGHLFKKLKHKKQVQIRDVDYAE
ncbi:integral membrane protein, YjbE family [Thermoflavimicrobium dichotomicum]|uniref:Integral membrane protein, YjbE family n=2 Tax=Thermoflavimicrobium dichotomicum TaxID=46223 RepID=A0A1I3JNG7_9BACL|nr:integral membrane protein, YjbE family [Thermoflavimicrobium dichotomicum]